MYCTSVEHEAVHPHLFVACNADALNQSIFIRHCAERRHEPAVAIISLTHIIRGGALDKEAGFDEDILQNEPDQLAKSRCAGGGEQSREKIVTSILLTDMGWNVVLSSFNAVRQSGGISGHICDRLKSASMSKCGSRYF